MNAVDGNTDAAVRPAAVQLVGPASGVWDGYGTLIPHGVQPDLDFVLGQFPDRQGPEPGGERGEVLAPYPHGGLLVSVGDVPQVQLDDGVHRVAVLVAGRI